VQHEQIEEEQHHDCADQRQPRQKRRIPERNVYPSLGWRDVRVGSFTRRRTRRPLPDNAKSGMLGLARAKSARCRDPITSSRRHLMAAGRGTGGNAGGIGLGGILVIVGIVLMVVWSFFVGLIVTLVGLIAFGGFAKGKWY
jgi:hypothetical protein